MYDRYNGKATYTHTHTYTQTHTLNGILRKAHQVRHCPPSLWLDIQIKGFMSKAIQALTSPAPASQVAGRRTLPHSLSVWLIILMREPFDEPVGD